MDKDEKKLIVDTGKQGNECDKSKVVKDISAQAQSVELEPYTIETYEKDQDKPDAAAIAKDVNTEAKNATVNKKDGKTIEEAVDGVKVEESAISSAIGDASQQSYSIPVELTKAEVNGLRAAAAKGRAQTRSASLQSKAATRRPKGPVGSGNAPAKRRK